MATSWVKAAETRSRSAPPSCQTWVDAACIKSERVQHMVRRRRKALWSESSIHCRLRYVQYGCALSTARHTTSSRCAPTHKSILQNITHLYQNAMLFLISAIAFAGFSPLGHVLLQFKMVWHRYKLMLLSRASLRSAVRSSRESLSHL